MRHINKALSFLWKKQTGRIDVKRQGKIKFLLDKSPLPSWIRDRDMEIQYCNFAYADALDATPEGILEKQIPFYKEGPDGFALVKQALKSDTIQSTTATVIVAGKRRLYEITEIPTLDGEAVVGYAHDYTAIEDLQSSLERHIQASQDIYEFLGSAVAIFGSGRTLQFYNHAFVQMWQLEEEWLSQSPTIGEFLDQLRKRRSLPESLDFQNMRHEYMALFNSLLEPKQHLWHLPDERTIKITILPHPLGGIFFSYENVTDRLALERNYKSLLSVHDTVIQGLQEGLLILGSDARIRTLNESFKSIFSLEKPKEFYESMRIHDLLDALKPLLIRRIKNHQWLTLQKRLSAFLLRGHVRHGAVRLNDNTRFHYVLRTLPDSTFLFSCLKIPAPPKKTLPDAPLSYEPSLTGGVKIQETSPVLEMMDEIIPMFQSQFQYKAASISVTNTAGANVVLPKDVFQDCLKTLLSLIVLCVKAKSEVVMALKLLRGYVTLHVTFILNKESFHLLPRDLTVLPGITSLVRQYSQYVKVDVELAEGDIMKVSFAFFPNE